MIAFEGQEVPQLAEALSRAERVTEPSEQGDAVVEQAPCALDVALISRTAGEVTQCVGNGGGRRRSSSGYEGLLEALSVRRDRDAAEPVCDSPGAAW